MCVNNKCGRLCPNFVVTTAVAFAGDTLTLTLPDNVTYTNGCKYCFVIGQTLPDATTLTATVEAVIGAGTTAFPVLTRCGSPVTAQQLATRTLYPVIVSTSATGGSLRMLRCLPNVESTTLNALNDAGGDGA